MSTVVYASRRELTSTEILEIVDAGGRVVVEGEFLGKTLRMVIRSQDETYYCDTPMKLLTHETREAIRDCLETFRIARPDHVESTEEGSTERGTASA